LTIVPFAMRARMNDAAWLSELNTAGTELPPVPGSRQQPCACRFGSGLSGDHSDVL
jgi:hypothetical protein